MTTTPFELITFDRTVLTGEIASVSVPTLQGEITVLPHHEPLITAVMAGEVKISLVTEGKIEKQFIAVGAGFLEVTRGGVHLLTRTAEIASEIDETRVKEAIEKAQKRLADLAKSRSKADNTEIAETSALLARNLARLGVIRRRKHG